MPKRINHIAEKIYDIDNIYYADSQARRGKKNKYWINEHDRHKEEDNLELSNSLKNDTYQVSEYKIQKILEATGGKIKERTLKKLPYYPDRIAQWSMMTQLIPIWDKTFIANTYSCIIGRGIHACARDVKKALHKDIEGTKYCFKLDIKKCYDSINHSVLSLLLERKIKDKLVLSWLNKTIQSTEGIPIGSFTSQYFVNIYLGFLDHYIKEVLRVKYYFRYADDMVIFASTKEELHYFKEKIFDVVYNFLLVEVKSNYQIFPVDSRGVDFVGYVFYHNKTLLRKSIKKRMLRLVNDYISHRITIGQFKRSFASYQGWLKFCNSKNLLRKVERLTGLHVSNWNGERTAFRFIKNKSVKLVDIEVRKSYYKLNFIYKKEPYYIITKNRKLYYTLVWLTNKDIILKYDKK